MLRSLGPFTTSQGSVVWLAINLRLRRAIMRLGHCRNCHSCASMITRGFDRFVRVMSEVALGLFAAENVGRSEQGRRHGRCRVCERMTDLDDGGADRLIPRHECKVVSDNHFRAEFVLKVKAKGEEVYRFCS